MDRDSSEASVRAHQHGGTLGAAWSPSRAFVFAGPDAGVTFGTMTSEATSTKTLGASRAVHAGWDGKAFVVHWDTGAQPAPSTELVTTRHSEQGDQLGEPQKFTQLGETYAHLCTEPKSGFSYRIAGSVDSLLLASHTREGMVSWDGKVTREDTANTKEVVLGVDSLGGWLLAGASGSDSLPRAYRLGLGSTVLPGLTVPTVEPIDSLQTGVASRAVHDAFFVGGSGRRLMLWEKGSTWDTGIGEPRDVIVAASPDDVLSFRDVLPFYWGDDKWLLVRDLSSGTDPALRVLRVEDPTCTYPPLVVSK